MPHLRNRGAWGRLPAVGVWGDGMKKIMAFAVIASLALGLGLWLGPMYASAVDDHMVINTP
jgi:hypothetical protein